MRADREVVAAALRVSRGEALQYATASMRADPNLVESVLKYNGVALRHAAPELRADRALVRAAVEQSWAALKAAAPALRSALEAAGHPAAARGGVPCRQCFQLFGFDVMLDADASPWLLEVRQAVPDLATSGLAP